MELVARRDPHVCDLLLTGAAGAEFAAAHGVVGCASAVAAAAAPVRDPARYADRLDPASLRVQRLEDGRALLDECAIRWRGDHLGEYAPAGSIAASGPPPGRIITSPVAAGTDPDAGWVTTGYQPC